LQFQTLLLMQVKNFNRHPGILIPLDIGQNRSAAEKDCQVVFGIQIDLFYRMLSSEKDKKIDIL